jgi:dihydropteroate synthase
MKRPTTGSSGSIPLKKGYLDYSSRSLVVGVINVTPDSFSDGGHFYDPIIAIQHGTRLVREGADALDVGGESTRPGAEPLPVAEELERVLPVIQGLVQEVKVPIAVDTYKAEVAGRSLEAGATIVNDISALRFDPEMADVVVQHQAAVVLMHMQGTPRDMQQDPHYEDLLDEVYTFLQGRIDEAQSRGIPSKKIIIDPGIGFGKTLGHNLLLIKHLSHFQSLRKPILLGTSRKSFIGHVLGTPVDEREEGTAATVAVGIWNGAQIVRAHDVRRAVRVARMTDAILRAEL